MFKISITLRQLLGDKTFENSRKNKVYDLNIDAYAHIDAYATTWSMALKILRVYLFFVLHH